MSEKIIAASKPKRSIGWSVTVAAISGVIAMVQNDPALARAAWYSGR
jgi:hypothetical protein